MVRLATSVWRRLGRISSVTRGFATILLMSWLFKRLEVYIVGFGGSGHAQDHNARIWEGIVSEHVVLKDVLLEAGVVHLQPSVLRGVPALASFDEVRE